MASNLNVDLRDQPEPLPVPASALAIGAHPDDIEFGAGGALAQWAATGCAVTMLVVTDGSKGTWDLSITPDELRRIRVEEQQGAARVLAATTLASLNLVDGEIENSMTLRGEMCKQIRLAVPEVVLTHDPWERYQLHPDHRTTGISVVDGVVAARDHLFFTDQGLPPHRPSALMLWSADEPDHWEDITDGIDAKIRALLCHRSQGRTTMGGADGSEDDRHTFEELIRTRAADAGRPVGLRAAEAFKLITP